MGSQEWKVPHEESTEKSPCLPARYVLALLAFFGFFNLYALRVNMSVAIVAMVVQTTDDGLPPLAPGDPGVESWDVCPMINDTTAAVTPAPSGQFVWDSQLQGIILGSFFYGYILTQLVGSWVAKRFGPKLPFGLATLFAGILALFIPVAAKWHVGALIATRMLQGVFQGVCFPSMHTMMSLWCPPLERSKIVTLAYAGSHVGTVCALMLSGVLAETWGWESIFYFFGVASCVWYVFWFFLVFDSPDTHPRISKAERAYITSSINRPKLSEADVASSTLTTSGRTVSEVDVGIPWRHILTSPAVLAICVGHFGNNWGFYTLLTNLPTYFSKILHFSMKKNGVMSALPYLALAVLMPICGATADVLRRRRVFSTTVVRKIFHCLGQIIPAGCLVAVGFIGCDITWAVVMMILAVGGVAFAQSGFQVNHIDVSPTYAGTLMALSNMLGTIPGIVGPYIVGLITSGHLGQTISQWRIVFYISAGVYLVTGLFYAIFASGEQAKWEKKRTDKSLEEQD